MSRLGEMRRFEALIIPNDALERGGLEVLRAAIVEAELHVTLRPTFEQPEHWGKLLSEVVDRIARCYATAGTMNERDVTTRIRASFMGEDPDFAAGKKKIAGKFAKKTTAVKKRKSRRNRKKRKR